MPKKRRRTSANVFDIPYLEWLPSYNKYCRTEDINKFHKELCVKLDVEPVFSGLVWSFEKRFRETYGQAEYWTDDDGTRHWKIRYALYPWVSIGVAGRKNLITHEMCHLAVEYLYGHDHKKGENRVVAHGKQWQDLMRKCGEDPFMEYKC